MAADNTFRPRPGEVIRIRSLEWFNENKDETNSVGNFVDKMTQFCGQTAMIDEYFEIWHSYHIDIDGHEWVWEDYMFEL